jgi:small redox-active disulfide protein 2
MKKILILGPGCPNCNRLADLTARELGIEFELHKVTEIVQITAFGVMATPGLAVDGEVLVSGRVPSETELKQLLG